MYGYCYRNKVKCIVSLEEDCAALTREVKQGKDVVAKLLLVVSWLLCNVLLNLFIAFDVVF